MNAPIPIMSKLFSGITREDGALLMDRLGATVRRIPKGDLVFRAGIPKRNFGVLLDGRLEMFEIDSDGRRSIVGYVVPPETFALVFAFALVERHPASVMATEDSVILVVPVDRVLPKAGFDADPVHRRFLRNLMSEICEQAWTLRSRAFILSRRSTEERLLTYLRQRMNAENSTSFYIPYDRQELADFLCVDRSALSTVMGKMAKRGLIQYRKNHFTLLGKAAVICPDEP